MTYDEYPLYQGSDLGLQYTPEKATLKVWSPAIDGMMLNLYRDGHSDSRIDSKPMNQDKDGVWSITLSGNWAGKYYNFEAKVDNGWSFSVPDPYAKAVGLNGERAMFIDLATTNPAGWANDQRPPLKQFNDIIIYEMHVRDISIHPSSGIQRPGKFLGLVEAGSKNPAGLSTGLDHFKELGVTHVHLLPAFDFMGRSTDESQPNEQYNWGYDPQNYNVPEGAYSSNPYDGEVRIKEFKQMVQTFHQNGIRVILDVVYNHTGMTEESNFNQLTPGYYYRHNEDGQFSNASGCGNETASERPMVRKFMLESMKHWVEEYHIDGFRVDLMGIHDIATMNLIAKELHQIDPTIFIYGEGWTAGDSPLPVEQRSLKAHAPQLEGIAVFSDDIRDGLKGSVFDKNDRGFASGKAGMESTIQFGIVGATQHPQIDYAKVNYSDAPWATQPDRCINYVSCHDNHTLFDKLTLSTEKLEAAPFSEEKLLKMHRLANTIVLTSQGIPFLHAGVDLVRTKQGEENSYKSPDAINQIDWNRKTTYQKHFNYYKQLIALRKNHPAFRMTTTAQIQKHLQFLPTDEALLVAYQISDHANGDAWKDLMVVFNGNDQAVEVSVPKGKWKVILQGDQINENGLATHSGKRIKVGATEALILAMDRN